MNSVKVKCFKKKDSFTAMKKNRGNKKRKIASMKTWKASGLEAFPRIALLPILSLTLLL